jgi:hypothetical protein
MARNTFTRRDGGTFPCGVCGRLTRHTGVQSRGNDICPQCYDLAGIENEISDGYCTQAERQEDIDALVGIIAKRGGDVSQWKHLQVIG